MYCYDADCIEAEEIRKKHMKSELNKAYKKRKYAEYMADGDKNTRERDIN